MATLCGHTGAVTGACELSKGKFVSVSSDKMMKVWEMEDDIRKGGVGLFGVEGRVVGRRGGRGRERGGGREEGENSLFFFFFFFFFSY